MQTRLYAFVEELQDRVKVKKSSGTDRVEWLIRALDAYCGYTQSTMVLVMEPLQGRRTLPETEARGNVTLVRRQTRQDGLLFVSSSANREDREGLRVEVVTGYRQLQNALATGGCRICDPDHFSDRLEQALKVHKEKITNEPRQKFEGLSDAEVDYWVKVFTQRDKDL